MGTLLVYPQSQQYKAKLSKNLLEQVLVDNDPETYSKYKDNFKKLSKAVRAKKQDLNGDGKEEYIILGNSPFVCGSGGCQLWIYQKGLDTNKYQAIHPIDDQAVLLRNDSIKVTKTTTNGYFDLECLEGSYQSEKKIVLKFNGTRYSRVL